jgi:hypothetical protein
VPLPTPPSPYRVTAQFTLLFILAVTLEPEQGIQAKTNKKSIPLMLKRI